MSVVLGLAVIATSSSAAAQQEYQYTGDVVTDVSANSCLPMSRTQEGANVTRSLTAGLSTSSLISGMAFVCPLSRRNTSDYGVTQVSADRVLMTSLTVNTYDGSTTGWLWCYGYVNTNVGSTYYSDAKNSCSGPSGCINPPAASYTGWSWLTWSYPFGYYEIKNLGSANVGYRCWLPNSSSVLWGHATYSPN